MKDKYIPDLVMAVLDKRQAEMQKWLNTPFVACNNIENSTVEDVTAVQLSFLRIVLEDIFGEDKNETIFVVDNISSCGGFYVFYSRTSY